MGFYYIMALFENPVFLRTMACIGYGGLVGAGIGYLINAEKKDKWIIGFIALTFAFDYGTPIIMKELDKPLITITSEHSYIPTGMNQMNF